jgi:hypothetical protein
MPKLDLFELILHYSRIPLLNAVLIRTFVAILALLILMELRR